MNKYRISATQLDAMWKHTLPPYDKEEKEGDTRHLTAEQLVQYLTVFDDKAPALIRGGALHKILEHPTKYYNNQRQLHINGDYALQVSEEQATKLLPPDCELVEHKGEIQINCGWDKVTLVAKADAITPNAIVDYKFSGRSIQGYGYDELYQWRANLLVFNKPCFIYRHIEIKEEALHSLKICTVKNIGNHILYPYPSMLEDVASMCDELIRFCKTYNILHIITPK